MKARNQIATARKRLLRRGRALLRTGAARAEKDDILSGLDEAQRRELAAVHGALERIERGIYGRCEGCFDDIDAGRLEAEPHAALCHRCAGAQQRIGAAEAHAA